MPTISSSTPRGPIPKREQKLLKVIQATDPITSAIAGPARIALGVSELARAHSGPEVGSGLNQIATGALSTVYGAITALMGIGLAVGTMGLAPLAVVVGSGAAAIGGSLVAGYTGGGAAIFKGVTDVYRGKGKGINSQGHDRAQQIGGVVKLASAGVMIAGAVAGAPLLVTAGMGVYVLAACISNRKMIANIAKTVYNKVFHHDKKDEATPETAEKSAPEQPLPELQAGAGETPQLEAPDGHAESGIIAGRPKSDK